MKSCKRAYISDESPDSSLKCMRKQLVPQKHLQTSTEIYCVTSQIFTAVSTDLFSLTVTAYFTPHVPIKIAT
jgi:hypothetical protein